MVRLRIIDSLVTTNASDSMAAPINQTITVYSIAADYYQNGTALSKPALGAT